MCARSRRLGGVGSGRRAVTLGFVPPPDARPVRYTSPVARVFPPDPSFPDDGGAERAVWEALRDGLPDDALLFAGRRLVDDDVEREIDALVAWPGVGIAVIECKGGHVTCVDGAWHQGTGKRRRRIDPASQATSARHALTELLRRRGLGAASARAAHLVALPHTYVPAHWESAELPRTLLVDRGDLEAGPHVVAGRVRRALAQHGRGRPLDEDDAEALVAFLAATLPGQSETLAAVAAHETRLEQMTRDQARVLDLIAEFPRARVIGGAGTGKTWLALEQARRRARAGERVALLCYSRGLGRYFERMTAAWRQSDRPAFVGLFHELPVRWGAERGAEDDPDDWERRLPLQLGELAVAQPWEELFDTAVVDEAQDFGDLWWPSLLRCLRQGPDGGLFVFSDDAQRVFPRESEAPIDLPPIHLHENLRSTKQIAQLFSGLAEERLTPRGLDGPPVRVVDVPAQEAVSTADDAVDALLGEGWQPGQVALLTTQRRHPEQVNAVDVGGYAAYWGAFLAGHDVFYGHVLNFKGLERPAIVLAVNGFRQHERAKQMLYTGLSRARSLLVLVGPRALVEQIGGEGVRLRLAAAREWVPGV